MQLVLDLVAAIDPYRVGIEWVVVEVDGDDGTQSCLWLSTGAKLQAPSSLASTNGCCCCEGGVRTFFDVEPPLAGAQSTARYPGPIAEKAGVNINSLYDRLFSFFPLGFDFLVL